MKTTINYLPNNLQYKSELLWYHKRNLMQTATGYGHKLVTEYKVHYNNKWYRIYCHCFSNIGSLYIVSKGKNIYIKNESDIIDSIHIQNSVV